MNRKKILDILPPKKIIIEKIEKKKLSSFGVLKKGLAFAFLILILFGVTSYFVLAKVKIEIWPKTQILDQEEKLTADSDVSQIDSQSKVIPAKIIEIEEEAVQEFPSSGKIEKEAEGKIRVYNKYNLPVALKAGTRFQPANKEVIYFCSSSKINIPAKSFSDVQVKACLVKSGEGEKYNIEPSKFSIPGLSGSELFFYVYGESFESMKGGGRIPQVTKEDIEKAQSILTDALFSKLDESLRNKISTDFIVLKEATKKEILEMNPDVQVGTQTESFKLQGKAKLRLTSFSKLDLESFIKEYSLSKTSKDKKFQVEILKIDFQPESISADEKKIILDLKFSTKIFADFNSFSLKENLKGKSVVEGKRILESQEDILKAQISAWPFWLRKIPLNTEKIELEINVDTSKETQY